MVVDYLQTCDFLVFISEASLRKLIRDEDSKLPVHKQWHMAIFQKNSQDDIK